MKKRSVKVIFDTNVWISFLIGKRLSGVAKHISNREIIIVITEQLLTELNIVTQWPKLKKYFDKNQVKKLVDLLEVIAEKVEIEPRHQLSRDPKDNFLLDLIDFSKADFLVTGDKDLLDMGTFKKAAILTPEAFENHFQWISVCKTCRLELNFPEPLTVQSFATRLSLSLHQNSKRKRKGDLNAAYAKQGLSWKRLFALTVANPPVQGIHRQ